MNDLLTINEAAGLLGVSKITLRNWDKNAILKALRIGKRGDRRYKRADIEALLKGKETPREINKEELDQYIAKNKFWSEEIAGLPIPLEMGVRKMVETESYFKPGYNFCFFLYENDYVKQLLSVEESVETCKNQLLAIHDAPSKISKFLSDCKRKFLEFDKAIIRFSFLDVSKLSANELNSQFQLFQEALGKFWEVTLVVEPYSPFLDEYYVPKFEKEVGNEKLAREAFPVLTLPSELSFVSQERRDLLKIIVRFLRAVRERNFLIDSSDADYLTYLKFENPKFLSELQKHQQEYFWTQNGYGQWNVLTVHNFLDFIREIIKSQTIDDLKKELKELDRRTKFLRDQEDYLKKLKLSARTLKELEYLKKVVWIKDERKRYVLKMLHVIYAFLTEYASRTQMPMELIAHASVYELPRVLARDFNVDILKRRRERNFFISQRDDRASFITGNEAVVLKEKLAKPHIREGHETIHGMIACRGDDSVITGTVKVILDSKNQTIEENEILVTSMTRPEFIALMRKARAVVTDEGGITCHAAIVSREMNKPCIIGTKMGTKVLKTGDKVEMRMNHGTVKVID